MTDSAEMRRCARHVDGHRCVLPQGHPEPCRRDAATLSAASRRLLCGCIGTCDHGVMCRCAGCQLAPDEPTTTAATDKAATFDELDAALGDLCSWAERAVNDDDELGEVTALYAKIATLAKRLRDA